jgi:type II secretory pathway predicted ATPase ExeA
LVSNRRITTFIWENNREELLQVLVNEAGANKTVMHRVVEESLDGESQSG